MSIRLDKAIQKGTLQLLKVKHGVAQTIAIGERMLVLTGIIRHITGTDTVVQIHKPPYGINDLFFRTAILSAKADGYYPMFNTKADEEIAQWQPVILEGKDRVKLDGDALGNAHLVMLVLVW